LPVIKKMQNVIETLKYYSKEIDLKERFDFNIDISDKIFKKIKENKM
jgi:hypothetical protein